MPIYDLKSGIMEKEVFRCDADHFVRHMRTIKYLYTSDVLIADFSYLETTEYRAAGKQT